MSSEVSQNNIGSTVGGAFTSSAIMTGGFGGITALKNHRKDVFKATKANNELLKAYADKIAPTHDTFTKNLKVAYNYQDYTRLAKQTAKANRKLEKLKNATELPFFEKIKNFFRKKENKLDLNGYKAKLKNVGTTFADAQDKLKAGKSISNEVLSHLDDVNDIKKATKGLFKSELKDPLGILCAVGETVSRFTSQAIPAFKNEGVVAGLKETGKALLAGGATFVTDIGLSVVFRTIGATIGGFLGPLGASIGSIVGNAVGGMMSNTLVQKIFPAKGQTDELAQDNIQQEVTTQAEQPQVLVTKSGATMPQDKTLTPEQVKQLAYAQAFQGKVPQVKYYA